MRGIRPGGVVFRWRYVVVALWLLTAGALNLAVPQLESTIFAHSSPMIPQQTPASRVLSDMGREFGESSSSGSAYLVLDRSGTLTPADHAYYDRVLAALRADRTHVESVMDLWSAPVTAGSVVSADNRAVYALVRLAGDTGTTQATRSVAAMRDTVDGVTRPDGLSAEVTGPSPTLADELDGIHRALIIITLVTIALITVLLVAVYRSLATAIVALLTIGLALATARPVVSLLGAHGLPISIFSAALVSAMILGAGTDYAIFLISRYHEGRRAGLPPQEAYRAAYGRIMPIILASGLIVVLTCAAMTLTRIGVFQTIGIPCAIGVAITVIAAATLTPAALMIAADWGLAEPKGGGSVRYWARLADMLNAHPGRMLAAGLVIIIGLGAVVPTIALGYDERATQPGSTPSNRGYAAAAAHFPADELLPIYVLVHADHDMRTPRDYAALETLSVAVARVPGIAQVRSISRPLGAPIAQASVQNQITILGDRLGSAASRLTASRPDVQRLADGSVRLYDGAQALDGGMVRLADGSGQARLGVGRLMDGTRTLHTGMDRLVAGATQLDAGARRLDTGTAQLATGVNGALAPAQGSLAAIDGLRTLVAADPHCATTPLCAAAKAALTGFDAGPVGAAVGELNRLRTGVQSLSDGQAQLATGADQLLTGLQAAQTGTNALLNGQTRLQKGLGTLDDGIGAARTGVDALANGSGQLRDGVAQMATAYDTLPAGLDDAVSYLNGLRQNPTITPAAGAFHLPEFAMTNGDLATAARYYLSPDGHTARMIVIGTGDPFSTQGMALTRQVVDAARTAAPRTPLAGTAIDATGLSATYSDIRTMAFHDLAVIVLAASVLILLVLALMLRSLIAPLYVFGTVLLSYLAALGLSVLLWQHLLGKPLHWAVPAMSFIALSAVGADYNLLMMSRVRDELLAAPTAGLRGAVRAALTRTGGVITTAGIVFAITMFTMLCSDITNIAQIGFTIGAGLLLDTLLVRTVTVPAMALLAGRWNWWPGKLFHAESPGTSATEQDPDRRAPEPAPV